MKADVKADDKAEPVEPKTDINDAVMSLLKISEPAKEPEKTLDQVLSEAKDESDSDVDIVDSAAKPDSDMEISDSDSEEPVKPVAKPVAKPKPVVKPPVRRIVSAKKKA